jgi:hypothetical protein
MTERFDFNGADTHVLINFLTRYLTAQDQVRPNWNPGDFFGDKFGDR